jgi:NADH-quinone oxidoreductase subunit N
MLKSFLPEFFLLFCILIQLIFNIKIIVNLKYNYPLIERESFIQSIIILICIFFLYLNLKISILSLDFFLVTDFTISFIKSVIIFFSIISLCLFFKNFSIQKLNFFEFFTLFLISIFSSLLMISSNDILLFYLSLEMQSLCFYVLSGFKRDSIFSSESGLKYYISGSLMSAVFLFGCVLIYFSIGTLSLQNIEMLLFIPINGILNLVLSLGFILILITFFFKIGAVPFYFFYPDIYEGSPLLSTIILSILPQLSLYFFIYKFLVCFNDNYYIFRIILDFCGCLSLLLGTFYSIGQKRIKRFFLYSSIAQTGFLLCCLSIVTSSSFVILYFYLILYLIISLLI